MTSLTVQKEQADNMPHNINKTPRALFSCKCSSNAHAHSPFAVFLSSSCFGCAHFCSLYTWGDGRCGLFMQIR